MTKVVTGLETLQAYRAGIETSLRQFFVDAPNLLGVEQSKHGQLALVRLEGYCLRPAKRLRGSLAALTYDTVTGKSHEPVGVELGVILELMQAYLLIVDDVMDRSRLRRGEPTVHELYKADGVSAHEADMIAINTGLLAQHLASLHLAKLPVPLESLVQAMQVMQRNIALTGFGQLDDISSPDSDGVTEADIIHKYIQKSSYYTFVNPLQLGFTMAGLGDEATLKSCEDFGVAAGIAFQLHDDYLGMFGAAGDMGKSTLDDLQEGKYTLLIHYALENCTAAEAETLQQLIGNAQATDVDLQTVQGIVRSSGADEYCRAKTLEYAEMAKSVLNSQKIGTPAFRQQLADIVDYSVSREK